MTLNIKRILAIVDPTTDKMRALEQALAVARLTDASVHAYVSCYSPLETDEFFALKRVEIARHEAWLEKVIAGVNVDNVKVTSSVEWNEDWREAMAKTVAEFDGDLVVKSAYQHSSAGRILLNTSDWSILRSARCPVLLVKRDASEPVRRVLIAINPKVEDPDHQKLNSEIIDIGHQLTAVRKDIDLHAVCAYTGTERFTHPPELAELVGIDESAAHCASGSPDDVIADCAKLLESDLVVIGTVSRAGLRALARGNTAERALDRLESDVLVVTARE